MIYPLGWIMAILDHPTIKKFLARHPAPHSGTHPLAVFDCDGTVIKGDIGEAMLYYQIEHFLFRQSPASIWTDYPLRDELQSLYEKLVAVPPDKVMQQPQFHHFADLILSWYFGQIAEGQVAKACADIVRLFAGFTHEEVREIAEASFQQELVAPPSAQRQLGERTLPRGARFIREAVDLVSALQQHGFAVWAVSGSNVWSIEPVFRRLGIAASHLIGIDLHEHNGLLTSKPRKPIPIREGKVDALRARIDDVPVLVASDSRNDIPLFLASADLKVRINSRGRDTGEFFRAAHTQPDDTWVLIEQPTIEL